MKSPAVDHGHGWVQPFNLYPIPCTAGFIFESLHSRPSIASAMRLRSTFVLFGYTHGTDRGDRLRD